MMKLTSNHGDMLKTIISLLAETINDSYSKKIENLEKVAEKIMSNRDHTMTYQRTPKNFES